LVTEPQDPYAGQPYQPPPGYPPPGYPGAYPPAAYQQPAYPPAAYQPYAAYPGYPRYPGYPPLPPSGPGRPSSVTGAAVLAFVAGGLLILAGLILVLGASFTDSLTDDFNQDLGSLSVELAIDGVVNLLAAMLLIMGGVMLLGGNNTGRTLTIIGTLVVVVASIYWIFRPHDPGSTLFSALIFAALCIIAASLLSTATARAWLATQNAASPVK
jgi:hypothetical protein